MYAIIDVKGKQYKVEKGKTVKMELPKGQKPGESVEFKAILVSGDDKKLQSSAVKVVGKVINSDRDKKVVVFKKRPKKGYKKTIGHRQSYTNVEIISIGN